MKVRYIGEEGQIGSRATLAFGRTWHIGEWVDVDSLGNAYWDQFGRKISANVFFEVEGAAPKVEASEVVMEASEEATAAHAPAKAPRKKKGA